MITQYDLEMSYSTRGILNRLYTLIDNDLTTEVHKRILEYISNNNSAEITAVLLHDLDFYNLSEELVLLSMKFREDRIQNIAFTLSHRFSCINDVFSRVQFATDILFSTRKLLFSFVKVNRQILVKSLTPVPKVLDLSLHKSMYPPPLIEEPKTIRNNNMSGYHSSNSHCVLGGRYKEHNEEICLDILNAQNSIVFVLDKEVIKDKEKSKKVLEGKDLDTFNEFVKQQDKLHRLYKNTKFYFNHKYDSRGRVYCEGYHITYQGTEYRKAAISLAHTERLTT